MNLKTWFFSFVPNKKTAQVLTQGSRVKVGNKYGTVMGGALNIRLDKPPNPQIVNDRTRTYNLDSKIEVIQP